MTPHVKLKVMSGAVGLVFVISVFWAVQSWVIGPQQAMDARIDSASKTLERRRADLLGQDRLQDKLDAYANRTFGWSQEEVDHALRAALSTLGESAGLSDVAVDTSPVKSIDSPGRRDFKGAAGKVMRDEVDFVEAPAIFRATGTWPQFNAMLSALSAEPWIRQVEGLRVVGKGKGGVVDVVIKLRTLFIPNREPGSMPNAQAVEWPESLAGASPFVLPPPPAPVIATPIKPGAPAKPPPPGWERWRVIFVGRIEGVDEVHLRATRGGNRQLFVGQALDGCVYLGNRTDSDGFDEAMFRREGATWLVGPGATFSDRTVIAR